MNRFLSALIALVIAGDCASVGHAQSVRYGRGTYTSRVCSNPWCEMCNRIETMLAAQRQQWLFTPVVTKAERRETRLPEAVKPVHNPLADTRLEPSPKGAVDAMLAIVSPEPGELLVDLGCGDGRILIAAAVRYGVQAVGLELNPESAKLARANAIEAGVTDRVLVLERDILDTPAFDADVVTMFLFPELIEAAWPKIKSGTRVVSLGHRLPSHVDASRVQRQVDGQTLTYFLAVKE